MQLGGEASCRFCGASVDVREAVSNSGWTELPAIKDMARLQFGQSYCQIEGTYVPVLVITGDLSPTKRSVNLGGLDLSYLPEITVCRKDPTTGEATSHCKTTTDLGQALIDGRFDHVGKIKGPILRGLAGRAPYFHNGSAPTLMDVVNFYDMRFNLHLSDKNKRDLTAFLGAL